MDRNFYNDDFEEFLKQKADQYKMYPSDRVWNNIYSSLHNRKKWIALGLTLLFIGSALLIGQQLVLSNYNKMAAQLNKGPEMMPGNKSGAGNIQQDIFPNRVKPGNEDASSKQAQQNRIEHASSAATAFSSAGVNGSSTTIAEDEQLVIENNIPAIINRIPAPGIASLPAVHGNKLNLKDIADKGAALPKENIAGLPVQNDMAAVQPAKPGKWFLQLYVSPIISYRRLSNENQPGYTPPVSASYAGNINRYVHHQPAPGFEVGSKVQYKLSNSLTLYAGAQINYSRYYIDAYKYHVEKASIALKNNSHSPDTLSGYTTIRNFSGYQPEQLQNQYWQLSVPVGIEIKLLGDKKLQLNVAGGVQPTFLINSNSYLISSDYKNYIQSPDLARTFNVHTNFEAFLSYQAAGFRWQLGPQFRSQLLSSYSNQYRVREYLTEFGIKFGITKSFR